MGIMCLWSSSSCSLPFGGVFTSEKQFRECVSGTIIRYFREELPQGMRGRGLPWEGPQMVLLGHRAVPVCFVS